MKNYKSTYQGNGESTPLTFDKSGEQRRRDTADTDPLAHHRSKDYTEFIAACIVGLLLGIFLYCGVQTYLYTVAAGKNAKTAKQALHTLNSFDMAIQPPTECSVTVLILRHCNDFGAYAKADKELGDKHCSYLGMERSDYIATLFDGTHWPETPDSLYALLPSQKKGVNYRQIETILPLAEKTNTPIHIVQSPEQVSQAIFTKLQTTDMCGKAMVISWKHKFIPELAANLGCAEKQGCNQTYPDEEFDLVWQLRYVYDPPPPSIDSFFSETHKNLRSDDYGLLPTQSLVETFDEASVGWTVYGTTTNQGFDPLAVDMKQQQP